MSTNWESIIEQYKDEIIHESIQLIAFESVYDPVTVSETTPFGIANAQCLQYMLNKGKQDGFEVTNYDNYAGTIELNQGSEVVGIACHLDVVDADKRVNPYPFKAYVYDDILFGRGSNDNKGPTIAAYMALKIVANSKIKLNKSVHLILGCNEESGMKCMDYYLDYAKRLPQTGFVCDCTFPVNHGEHGSCLIDYSVACPSYLTSLHSSLHKHITSGFAHASVQDFPVNFKEYLDFYCSSQGIKGKVVSGPTHLDFSIEGKSAHGSRPAEGINAAYHLLNFVFSLYQDKPYQTFIQRCKSTDGRGFNIHMTHPQTGTLSIAITQCTLENNRIHCTLDCRYPSNHSVQQIIETIQSVLANDSIDSRCQLLEDSPGFYISNSSELVLKLENIYKQTFQDFQAVSKVSAGDTYARKFKGRLVGFGPTTRNHLQDSRIGQAHQNHEGMHIPTLLKATAVYCQAIVELAR